ncbi:MAG: hypothetical protein Q9227_006388 [Pyrenula ochraceoflavens]
MKDIYGKPRPDLLDRCDPDLQKLASFQVGGLGQKLANAPILVTSGICRDPHNLIDDGFASFPSGHSSASWAGLLYLSLFLCSKFAIAIPILPVGAAGQTSYSLPNKSSQRNATNGSRKAFPARNRAAAPPTYLLILAAIPVGTAVFISGSRWFNYRHHGFDILFGSLIGVVFAWFGFRWYHLPVRRGAGGSWGARSKDRAFYLGLGVPSYAGEEGWASLTADRSFDIEHEASVLDSGVTSNADHPTGRDERGTTSNSESSTPPK